MAVDRGELQYRIEIQDKFTRPIRRFREELLKAKNTLEFVRDSGSGFRNMRREVTQATTAVRRFRDASTSSSSEERAANRESARRLREIANEQRKRAQVEKLRADILRQQRVESQRAAAAERRAAREAERAQRRAAAATAQHTRQVRALRAQLLGTEGNVNRVAFTFRRLFGILAAFTIAREVVSGFSALVGSAVRFNSVVENTEIGLGALFATLGEVRDAQGKLLEGGEAFAESQKVARQQMAELRKDAIRTSATFEQLVETFQVAIAPGLGAGFELDEIRKLTTRVSQAASAIQVPQNQLAEEIRALLIPGAATARTSRIFTALQISPAELKAAKEAGTLFEFLEDRLKTFDLAAEATQKTFSGLIARLQDAIGLASGEASLGFFTELKELLGDIGSSFITIERDADGFISAITPNPKAVQTLAILFEGLRDAVANVRAGIQGLDLTKVQNSIALVAGTFRAISELAVGLITGLISGLSDVAVIAKNVFGAFNSPALREAAALISRLGVLLTVGSLAASALLGSFKLLLAPLTLAVNLGAKLVGFLRTSAVLAAKIPLPILAAVAAVTALAAGLVVVSSRLLGVQVGFKDLPEIIGATVEQATAKFLGLVDTIGTSVKVRVVQAFNSLVAEAGIAVDQLKALFDFELGASEDLKRLAARERELDIAKRRGAVANQNRALELQIEESLKRQAQIESDADMRAGQRIQNLRNEIQRAQEGDDNGIPIDINTEQAESTLASLLTSINSQLDGVFGGNVIDEEALAEKLAKVSELVTGEVTALTQKNSEVQLTAFDKLIQKMVQRSQSFLGVLQSSVQGFANFASSAIVDAFDPTKDVDLEERFARLLQDIAKQILQTIITLLIATAIAKAFGVPLPSNNESVPTLPTFAEGGKVPDSGSPIPRPSGVPASDTTLGWLTPGEVVQSLDAVRKYGADFLLALNQGALDPAALRSMAGLDSQRKVRRSVSRSGALHFQDGGLVPAAGVQATREAVRESSEESGEPTVALVVGNEQSLDRMLAGGKKAMMDFVRANAAGIDGILAQNRT